MSHLGEQMFVCKQQVDRSDLAARPPGTRRLHLVPTTERSVLLNERILTSLLGAHKLKTCALYSTVPVCTRVQESKNKHVFLLVSFFRLCWSWRDWN